MPELLRKLSEIRGLYWIRILYCYPEEITEELIDTIAELPKVCHYLDIPIQHASDKILKRMGRRTNQQQLKDKIAMIRSKIPDMCLRTTLITGFPGESQEDHEQSMAFVDEMEFDRLGVFTYSPEEDTPAATMTEQIPEEVKERVTGELKNYFRPEFLNRVDDIIVFSALTLEQVKKIIDLAFKAIANRLADRDMTLTMTDAAKELIAKESYDPQYGARPIKRYLQKHVENELASMIIRGDLVDGGKVTIDSDGKTLFFNA